MRWNLSYSYLELPELLYTVQPPSPVSGPRLAVFNEALARDLGLGAFEPGDLAVLCGNAGPPSGRPFAQAYAGHQYAHFTMLGDGRALVLGEHRTSGGRLFDLQLKGSGPTPYSRNGDGRAALGPMLREYLMGEAMHALGIPTTRALAVVETGESVWRETELPGAVLTRVAESHLRVGTFEYAAATEDRNLLESLTAYAIQRHYPEAVGQPAAFLEAVIEAQARLVAHWMAVGFVHGVMNTDNMAVSGQTIDYGPCAFLDTYRAGQVFSSIDRRGRYAYANQPGIARWNLTRFAETLLPLLDPDLETAIGTAQALIDGFAGRYQGHYLSLMRAKLGLAEPGPEDQGLVEDLLAWMEASGADYTATFVRLGDSLESGPSGLSSDPAFESWYRRWRGALAATSNVGVSDRMAAANPVYVPRNHRVEEALAAADDGDLGPLQRLLEVLRSPFDRRPGWEIYEEPPVSEEPYVTYCGT